ncbi:hypothetical protein HN876_00570 [archaeon]|nr:hypothetical protein [archaeon]MBT6606437.1 hypothetical protein [archaeon]MBT7251394.1 hypothetical protein [archaeon]
MLLSAWNGARRARPSQPYRIVMFANASWTKPPGKSSSKEFRSLATSGLHSNSRETSRRLPASDVAASVQTSDFGGCF